MKKVIIICLFLICSLFLIHNRTFAMEIENEELRDGYFYEEKMNMNLENYPIEIKKISPTSDGFIALGSGRDDEEYIPHLDFYSDYPFIAYYDKNGKVWSYLDKTIGYGAYFGAVKVGEDIIAFGSYEDGSGIVKLLLTKFNNHGNVKSRINLDANKSSFASSIFYNGNHYYLVGTTSATHFFIDSNNITEKIFVLELDSNLNYQKIIFIYNQDFSAVYDACMYDDYLYILGKLSGTGAYDNDYPLPSCALFSVDYSLTNIEYEQVIYNNYMKIGCDDEGVYYIRSNNKINNLSIDYFDTRLSFKERYNPFSNYDYDLLGMAVGSTVDGGDVGVYAVAGSGDNYYAFYLTLGSGFQKKEIIERSLTSAEKVFGVYLIGGYFYLFSDFDTNPSVNKMVYLKNIDGSCFANNIKLAGVDENINTDLFGTYKRKRTYNFYGLMIETYYDYVVPLKISIQNKGVYDRKVKLEFNGIGYLNDERIYSGHIVNEEGRYVLEIRGNNEKKYFTFEVKKLVIDENEFGLSEVTVSFNKDSGRTKTSYNSNGESFVRTMASLNNFESDGAINYLPIIICGIGGIIIGIFVPFGKIFGKKKERENE